MRRLIVRSIVVLFLGAAGATAVSWGLMIRQGWDSPVAAAAYIAPEGERGGMMVIRYRYPGSTEWNVNWGAVHPHVLQALGTTPRQSPEEVVPAWARDIVLPPQDAWAGPEDYEHRIVRESGWPFPGLWAWYRFVPDSDVWPLEPQDGITLPGTFPGLPPRYGSPVSLPLKPAGWWFGLNVLVYSAAWALMLFGPGAIRRVIRRRRGRCTRCGYDLRHDWAAGCPECGWGKGEALA